MQLQYGGREKIEKVIQLVTIRIYILYIYIYYTISLQLEASFLNLISVNST